MCESQIGLSDPPKRVKKITFLKFYFLRVTGSTPYKNDIFDATATDRGYFLLKRKWTLMQTDAVTRTFEDRNSSSKFGFLHQDTCHSTQAVRRRQEPLEWEGVFGLLASASASMAANHDLETDTAVVTRYPVSFEFSTSRVLYCQ